MCIRDGLAQCAGRGREGGFAREESPQIVRNLHGRPITVGSIAGKALPADGVEVARKATVSGTRSRDRRLGGLAKGLQDVLAGIWGRPGPLVQQAAFLRRI